MESRRVIPKKPMAIQVVNRARTLVVCEPKTLSVIPPPNADPRPSLRGLCIRTTSTSIKQTMTCKVTKIGIKIDIKEREGVVSWVPQVKL